MKYSVIVCDDDEVLAKNLAKNIKYAVVTLPMIIQSTKILKSI